MNEREIAEKMIKEGKEMLDRGKMMITNAEAELAELDKPKLRHGDYFGDGLTRLVVLEAYDQEGVWNFIHKDGSCDHRSEKEVLSHIGKLPHLGNIFDDLAEMVKPLNEFKTDVHTYRIDKKMAHSPIYMAGNWHTIPEVEEHIRKLGRLIATAKTGE